MTETTNLRSILHDEELTDQIVRLTDLITQHRQTGDLDRIPDAQYGRQLKIDTLHARVLGECEGCARTACGRWGHRLSCETVYTKRGRTFVGEVVVLG